MLALLASFSAPGVALAHGTAHHREDHGPHGTPASEPEHHGAQDHRHEHGHSHGEHGTASAVADVDPPAPVIPPGIRTVAPHGEPDPSHGHSTLDLPVRTRVEMAIILPLLAAATTIAPPETEVASAPPVPHAALPRPDPDAEPPPRTRAPPLR